MINNSVKATRLNCLFLGEFDYKVLPKRLWNFVRGTDPHIRAALLPSYNISHFQIALDGFKRLAGIVDGSGEELALLLLRVKSRPDAVHLKKLQKAVKCRLSRMGLSVQDSQAAVYAKDLLQTTLKGRSLRAACKWMDATYSITFLSRYGKKAVIAAVAVGCFYLATLHKKNGDRNFSSSDTRAYALALISLCVFPKILGAFNHKADSSKNIVIEKEPALLSRFAPIFEKIAHIDKVRAPKSCMVRLFLQAQEQGELSCPEGVFIRLRDGSLRKIAALEIYQMMPSEIVEVFLPLPCVRWQNMLETFSKKADLVAAVYHFKVSLTTEDKWVRVCVWGKNPKPLEGELDWTAFSDPLSHMNPSS